MFDLAERALRRLGTDYHSVARTWLYVSDILSWYGDLNKSRSACYRRFGLMPEHANGRILLPASTGIEGDTPSGAAVTMDLLAVELEPGSSIEVHQMTNPRQKDAFAYGSAFSRGAAVSAPGGTWISFSGTAAIDEAGVSCHPGDFRAQMHMTLDVVEALIGQEGASLSRHLQRHALPQGGAVRARVSAGAARAWAGGAARRAGRGRRLPRRPALRDGRHGGRTQGLTTTKAMAGSTPISRRCRPRSPRSPRSPSA